MHQESIRKKTGYVVMRADGIYDVDANTSIDQLSEELNVKLPEVISFFFLREILIVSCSMASINLNHCTQIHEICWHVASY